MSTFSELEDFVPAQFPPEIAEAIKEPLALSLEERLAIPVSLEAFNDPINIVLFAWNCPVEC